MIVQDTESGEDNIVLSFPVITKIPFPYVTLKSTTLLPKPEELDDQDVPLLDERIVPSPVATKVSLPKATPLRYLEVPDVLEVHEAMKGGGATKRVSSTIYNIPSIYTGENFGLLNVW